MLLVMNGSDMPDTRLVGTCSIVCGMKPCMHLFTHVAPIVCTETCI